MFKSGVKCQVRELASRSLLKSSVHGQGVLTVAEVGTSWPLQALTLGIRNEELFDSIFAAMAPAWMPRLRSGLTTRGPVIGRSGSSSRRSGHAGRIVFDLMIVTIVMVHGIVEVGGATCCAYHFLDLYLFRPREWS